MPRKSTRLANVPDWCSALRAHREREGISRAALALRAGISEHAVKAFEFGDRRPKDSTLTAIIDALGLTREEANPIRAELGYAPDWYAILHERFLPGAIDLQAEINRCPWPAFVTNQAIDVIFFNNAFPRILRGDSSRELLGPGERNLISQVSNPRFTELFVNLDEVATFMIGTIKGDPRWRESPGNPSPWLRDAMSMLLGGDDRLVARIVGLWNQAPPISHRARHVYRVCLHHPSGGVMNFCASASIADLWNELTWHEWVPEDAETWRLLDDLSDYLESPGQ